MIINFSDPKAKYEDLILQHLLVDSKDRNLIDQVLKTLEDKEERIVDVKVSFNGIEYDGQLLEDLLQKQWKLRCEKLDKKYSDLEALAIIKAQELFNKFTSDLSHPIFHKLDTIRECVEAVHLELDCYNPQLKDWSTDNE